MRKAFKGSSALAQNKNKRQQKFACYGNAHTLVKLLLLLEERSKRSKKRTRKDEGVQPDTPSRPSPYGSGRRLRDTPSLFVDVDAPSEGAYTVTRLALASIHPGRHFSCTTLHSMDIRRLPHLELTPQSPSRLSTCSDDSKDRGQYISTFQC